MGASYSFIATPHKKRPGVIAKTKTSRLKSLKTIRKHTRDKEEHETIYY